MEPLTELATEITPVPRKDKPASINKVVELRKIGRAPGTCDAARPGRDAGRAGGESEGATC
jgi:hypothetical protein